MDDNDGGARLLVRHLLNHGHQQIAGIFKSDDRQGAERYLGFFSELLAAGQTVSEDGILWYSTEARDELMRGRSDWLDRFIVTRLPAYSAVVCYNDEIAYPLIRSLTSLGHRVPEDCAVVSFDNSHLCTLCPVPITSLAHERHQMGTTAAKTLLQLMRGKTVKDTRLPWTLRERQSG